MSVLGFKDCMVRAPYKYQCDVCKEIFLVDDFDVAFLRSQVESQFAVVSYSTPAGFGDCTHTFHCCSRDCLFDVVNRIPFGATISIPCGGIYHSRSQEGSDDEA